MITIDQKLIDFARATALQLCERIKITDPNDRDDVISEAYLALCESAKSYKEEPEAKPTTYLTKCIRNAIIDWCRREDRYRRKIALIDAVEMASAF